MMEGISYKINISLFIHEGNKLAGAKEMLMHLALYVSLTQISQSVLCKIPWLWQTSLQ